MSHYFSNSKIISFVDDIICIPNNEFHEMYNPSDYGLDMNEINIINNIMNYLNKYKEEIKELCYGFDYLERDVYKQKNNNSSHEISYQS